ncbi:MAG TPA: DHA2 family efflux MFS transporter permease subunit [Gammaproteobacteria bacterium]|nr:DHA2 family efflux MFS transporter permease subunit [Gammaproteobacteria bacterium]
MSEAAVAGAGPARQGVSPWVIAPVVALAAFMEVLDISIANVALDHIAGAMSVSIDTSTWILTSYTVTNAIVVPISGWLSEVVGRKRFFQLSIAGFAIASLLCGIAPTIGMLVLFRAIQGIAGGGLQPVSQAILADAFPPAKRGTAFALYGLAVVFAPAIGPTIGGWITDTISWRWVFLINVPVGVIVFVLVQALVTDPAHQIKARLARLKRGIRLDWIGFSLLTLGLGGMQIVLDRGQQDDWFGSAFIVILTIVFVASLIAFVVWELGDHDPIVDLRLLRERNFGIANLQMFAVGIVLLASTALLPIFVQSRLGYTALDAGLVLTPGGIALVLIMPIMGRLVTKVDSKWLIAIGFLVSGTAMLWMGGFNTQTDYWTIVWARAFQAAGLAFLFIPINTAAYINLPLEKSSNASALINMSRNIGGSIGISLTTAFLSRRTQVHQSRLVENASNFNDTYKHALEKLGHAFAQLPGEAADAMQHGAAVIYNAILSQANMLAFIDDFHALAWMSFLLVPLAFFLSRTVGEGVHEGH